MSRLTHAWGSVVNAAAPRPFQRVLRMTLVVAMLGALAAPAAANDRTVTSGDGLVPSARFLGLNRFETAARIGSEFAPRSVSTPTDAAIIARAEVFPDALAGSYLAGVLDAPILLTGTEALDETTAAKLDDATADDLGVTTVYLLGSTAAISAPVETDLEGRGYQVERIGGAERNATAAMIATMSPGGTVGELDGERTAILALNDNFPDALVSGALSTGESFPLLLAATEELPPVTEAAIDQLDIERVIIAGGTSAIGPAVEAALVAKGIQVQRVFGETRTSTAVAFARLARSELGFETAVVSVARGNDFPDALALGSFAGRERFPILLTTNENDLSNETNDYLEEIASCEFDRLFVAGGPAAVSFAVELQAREALTPEGCDGFGGLLGEGQPNFESAVGIDGGDGPDTVVITYDEDIECDDVLASQFTYTDDDDGAVAALTVTCEGDELTLTLPSGTLTLGDGGVVRYLQSGDPRDRVRDLADNQAISPDEVGVPVQGDDPGPGPTDDPTDEPTDEPDDAVIEMIDLTPSAATNPVGADHTLTATVEADDRQDLQDARVRFEVTGGGSADRSAGTGSTGADGTTTFTFSNDDEVTNTITACTNPDGSLPASCREGTVSDTAIATWEERVATTLTLTPERARNLISETQTVSATVTDQFGDPVGGAEVEFTSEDSGEADSDLFPTTRRTSPGTGAATVSFTSPNPGGVTVTATTGEAQDTAVTSFVAVPGFFGLQAMGLGRPFLVGLNQNQSESPDVTEASRPIVGVEDGTLLVGMDVRPGTGQLYALGDDGMIYKIDSSTTDSADANAVGNINDPVPGPGAFDLGMGVGLDFDPDGSQALRVVLNDAGNTNLRVEFDDNGVPETTSVETPLTFDPDDENATEDPAVTAAAHTDSGRAASTEDTTLYYIDTDLDALLVSDVPDDGTVQTVGELGIDAEEVNGFDVVVSPSDANVAYAALTVGTDTRLYLIDLSTGGARLAAGISSSDTPFDGLAASAFVSDRDS